MHKILLTLLLLTLITSCGEHDNKNPQERLVKTIVIGGADSNSQRSYPGRVLAGQKVDLAFQVSGTLKEFPVKEGMNVAAHDLLAQLDQRDYQNRYDAAKSQFNTAELNYKRGETLVKSGTIAQATFDELRTKYESAKSNANIAKKALEDTSLYAPFAGLIARTFVNNFQEVQAKEKLMSLQNVDQIDIIIDVPEQDLINHQQVNQGGNGEETLQNAYIKFDALGDRRFDASIKEYATEADPTTQTYRVTLTMKSPSDVMILPGMTANLVVLQAKPGKSEATLVPVNAVAVDAEGNFYVWVVDEKEMKVHKKPVQVGDMQGANLRINSGLQSGERIVTAGVPYLEEGMKVRLFANEY
jgi:RND family efflux transporter MFP subunit